MRKAGFALLLAVLLTAAFLAGRYHAPTHREAGSARRVLYYVDPMHPAYKSDKPGIAPDCGMQLEPVYADGAPASGIAEPSAAMPAGTVSIDPEKQQLIGVRVASVEPSSGTRTVRLVGRVAADETRVYRVTSAVEGWVRTTHDDSTGTQVRKEQVLATFHSPELLSLQQGYISSLSWDAQGNPLERSTLPGARQGTPLFGDRLRSIGISEAQMKVIAASRQIAEDINVVAPADGFVLARNISPGQRFDKGTEFYRIADLSRVWVLADVFENDAQYFRPGTVATVRLPNQGKTLRARVSTVLPQFDPATRTLKLRLEADNPGFVLRPDMFVDVEMPAQSPAGLTVPVDAVLDSGRSKRVFVDRGNGYFEPREVETGVRFDDRVQIVKGLAQGERVVSAGTFLVDSESRLRAASGQPEAASGATQAKAADGEVHDPKCGMKVDPAKATAAGHAVEYAGTTYYFCSSGCKEEFQKQPQRYLAAKHASGGAGHD